MPTEANWNVGLGATTLLLDAISASATAAYSTRKLRTAYAGSCLRVRRSSGGESDIGFNANGAMDFSGLVSFVGVSDTGFVVTWYDQSGNGRDITQATAAQQPIIIVAGNGKSINNNPAIEFTAASTMHLENAAAISNFISASAYTVMTGIRVTTYSTGTNPEISGCIVVDNGAFWSPVGAGRISGADSINGNHFSSVDESVFLAGTTVPVNYVTLTRFGSGSISIYQNGGTPNTDATAGNVSTLTNFLDIGARPGSGAQASFNGLMTGVLIFSTALSNADVNMLGGGAGIVEGNMSSYNGTTWTTI